MHPCELCKQLITGFVHVGLGVPEFSFIHFRHLLISSLFNNTLLYLGKCVWSRNICEFMCAAVLSVV